MKYFPQLNLDPSYYVFSKVRFMNDPDLNCDKFIFLIINDTPTARYGTFVRRLRSVGEKKKLETFSKRLFSEFRR